MSRLIVDVSFGVSVRGVCMEILMVDDVEGRCRKEEGRRLKRFCTEAEAYDTAIALNPKCQSSKWRESSITAGGPPGLVCVYLIKPYQNTSTITTTRLLEIH